MQTGHFSDILPQRWMFILCKVCVTNLHLTQTLSTNLMARSWVFKSTFFTDLKIHKKLPFYNQIIFRSFVCLVFFFTFFYSVPHRDLFGPKDNFGFIGTLTGTFHQKRAQQETSGSLTMNHHLHGMPMTTPIKKYN